AVSLQLDTRNIVDAIRGDVGGSQTAIPKRFVQSAIGVVPSYGEIAARPTGGYDFPVWLDRNCAGYSPWANQLPTTISERRVQTAVNVVPRDGELKLQIAAHVVATNHDFAVIWCSSLGIRCHAKWDQGADERIDDAIVSKRWVEGPTREKATVFKL